MKRLIVFDLDGTLLLSREPDERLFVQSIKEVLGIKRVNTDWTAYSSVTDVGVVTEIIEGHGLQQTAQSVHDHFIALLRTDLAETPCREVPGATEMLSLLRKHPDFEWSVATGSWRESALLKIRSAGLVVEGLTTCDDSYQREQITQMSIERAFSEYDLPPDTPVTLVGDGPWDVEMANNLQLHFVGIDSGRERLLECGAKHVMEDYTDLEGFLKLVAQS